MKHFEVFANFPHYGREHSLYYPSYGKAVKECNVRAREFYMNFTTAGNTLYEECESRHGKIESVDFVRNEFEEGGYRIDVHYVNGFFESCFYIVVCKN